MDISSDYFECEMFVVYVLGNVVSIDVLKLLFVYIHLIQSFVIRFISIIMQNDFVSQLFRRHTKIRVSVKNRTKTRFLRFEGENTNMSLSSHGKVYFL